MNEQEKKQAMEKAGALRNQTLELIAEAESLLQTVTSGEDEDEALLLIRKLDRAYRSLEKW